MGPELLIDKPGTEYDVAFETRLDAKGFIRRDLVVVPLGREDWDAMSGETLRARLAGQEPGSGVYAVDWVTLPKVFAVRTREGRDGLLRIDWFKKQEGPQTQVGWYVEHVLTAKPAAPAGEAAPPQQAARVTLVTEGNVFLEKAVKGLGEIAATAVNPAEFARGGADPDEHAVVIFDRHRPAKPPVRSHALWFGVVPPGSGLRAPAELRKGVSATGWNRGHPVMRGLDMSKLDVGEALKLGVPDGQGWEVLVDAADGPLVVAREAAGRREVVLAFDVNDSTWPLNRTFPLFLHQCLAWLANGDAPAGQPKKAAGSEAAKPHERLGAGAATRPNPAVRAGGEIDWDSLPRTEVGEQDLKVPAAEDYRIAHGDMIELRIGDGAGAAETVERVRVGVTGNVTLPDLQSPVKLPGLTEAEAAAAVADAYRGVRGGARPRVAVTVQQPAARQFGVIGATARPGHYTITQNDTRVLGVLAAAAVDPAATELLICRRLPEPRVIRVPLDKLRGGERRFNAVVLPGDVLRAGPAPAAAGGPPPPGGPDLSLWDHASAELAKTHGLSDGQVFRIVDPPFTGARAAWVKLGDPSSPRSGSVGPLFFAWRAGRLHQVGGSSGADVTAADVVHDAMGLHWYQVEGLDKVGWPAVRGDVVVREDATPEDKLAALAAWVKAETGQALRITDRAVRRPCVVLRGGGTTSPGYPYVNADGRGGFAAFVTAEPLADEELARRAARLNRWGQMGGPEGWGKGRKDGLSGHLGAPLLAGVPCGAGGPDHGDEGLFWRTDLFFIAGDVVFMRPDDAGYADKLRRVLDNFRKQLGGDWQIEERDVRTFTIAADRQATAR